MNQTQILIVGAGPTGLVLALSLAKVGIKPRIIDRNSGPGQASRAMAVQARTLEFYRQLGFADELVSKGIQIESLHWRVHGKMISEIKIQEFGEGISPYPFILSFPQDDHERLLVQQLKAVGIEVEWETELTTFDDSGDHVSATLRKIDGTTVDCAVDYICGCDGARSAVREHLQLGFGGGTYEKMFYVADVEATGEAAIGSAFSICLEAAEFLIVLPVRSTGMNRLIGVVPNEFKNSESIAFNEIRPHAERAADIKVNKVNWFSTYRVHHRVADHFRLGRAFLLGDAGHIHSPVGGQGMNTGIGDAVNLSWKLAAVVQGRANASILDTYEAERIAFAHSLVATTDKMFQAITGEGVGHQLFRETIFPHLMPFVLGFPGGRALAFKLVSQTHIDYRDSALSDGQCSEIYGGDRLPWVQFVDCGDNFTPLESRDWQVHVYGAADQELRDTAASADIALHELPWTVAALEAGLMQNALYLVRPDGYVALASEAQDEEKLRKYLSQFEIVSRQS